MSKRCFLPNFNRQSMERICENEVKKGSIFTKIARATEARMCIKILTMIDPWGSVRPLLKLWCPNRANLARGICVPFPFSTPALCKS
jgi:hypothetical protein